MFSHWESNPSQAHVSRHPEVLVSPLASNQYRQWVCLQHGCSVLVLCGHLNVGNTAFACVSGEYRSVLCVCVFWHRLFFSCQRTWLRRRYLWNYRKREWWFTGCFLQQKPLPPVSTSPHPESWGQNKPQTLFGPTDTQYSLNPREPPLLL